MKELKRIKKETKKMEKLLEQKLFLKQLEELFLGKDLDDKK